MPTYMDQIDSSEDGAVAGPNQMQGDHQIHTRFIEVVAIPVIGPPADACTLPPWRIGQQITVWNNTTMPLDIYPYFGDMIMVGPVNAPFIIPPGAVVEFDCIAPIRWMVK